MSFNVEVIPKEHAIKAGKIKFQAYSAKVVKEEVYDIGFALLMIADDRAVDLYWRLKAAQLKDWVKRRIMETAVSNGVEAASNLLEEYLAKKPNGEVRIFSGEKWVHAVDIGDGEKFIEVPVAKDISLDFPENVYVEPDAIRSFGTINREMMEKIKEDIEGFFKFALRVAAAEKEARYMKVGSVLEEACREYFVNREHAEEILKKVEREVLIFKTGEKLIDEVSERRIIEVAGGYLVCLSNSLKIFFVDDNGGVYKISRSEGARTIRAVGFLAVEKRVPPGSTRNIDGGDLINVAKIVSVKRPDLAVVLIP